MIEDLFKFDDEIAMEETDWENKDLPDLYDDNDEYDDEDIVIEDAEDFEDYDYELTFANEAASTDYDPNKTLKVKVISKKGNKTKAKLNTRVLRILNLPPIKLVTNTVTLVGMTLIAPLTHAQYLILKKMSDRFPKNVYLKTFKNFTYGLAIGGMKVSAKQIKSVFEPKDSVKESASFLDGLFEDDYYPAMEADSLDSSLNSLSKVDGSEEEQAPDSDTPADSGEDGGGDGDDRPLAPAPKDTNVAKQTDQQLQDSDMASPDDELDQMAEDTGADDGSSDTGSDDTSGDTSSSDDTQSDPLKSIETKKVYKDKFVYLYNIITDSLNTMESFTPEYRSKICREYYTVQSNLSKLRSIIYDLCVEKLPKMTVDEVLRKYSLANNIFDVCSRQLKEFFTAYNREMEREEKKNKNKPTVTGEAEKKRKKKLHIGE